MGITIGWGSEESWQGYDSRCSDHRWSTDAGRLDEISMTTWQLVTMLETNKGLPSGNIGCHLETKLTGRNEYLMQTPAYRKTSLTSAER